MIGRLFAIGIALLALGPLPVGAQEVPAVAAESRSFHALVEVFTSQGCESCAAADTVIAAAADRPGVVVLAYHVDYWDYLGWTDTLASPRNADRQRDYAYSLPNGSIYTPQAIVNGERHLTRVDEQAIGDALESMRLPADAGASIALQVRGETLHLVARSGRGEPAEKGPVLMLATFDKSRSLTVEAGENRGARLRNAHSVRDVQALAMVGAQPLEVEVPLDMLADADNGGIGCAAFLQESGKDGRIGRVLAAVLVDCSRRR